MVPCRAEVSLCLDEDWSRATKSKTFVYAADFILTLSRTLSLWLCKEELSAHSVRPHGTRTRRTRGTRPRPTSTDNAVTRGSAAQSPLVSYSRMTRKLANLWSRRL